MTASITASPSLDSISNIGRSPSMSKRHESMQPSEKEERLLRSPKEMLNDLLQQVGATDLRRAMRVEFKRLLTDHERLVSMLQQRSELLELENDDLRRTSVEYQRRYEKAVREMQFFRRKCELSRPPQQQEEQQCPRKSLSVDSRSSLEEEQQQQTSALVGAFPVVPSDEPCLSSSSTVVTAASSHASSVTVYSSPPYDAAELTRMAKQPVPVARLRQNSTGGSVHSAQSSSTEGASVKSSSASSVSSSASATADKTRKKQVQAPMATASSAAVPMTPVRPSTTTHGCTGASLIQQRRVDPLLFGGSDGLWGTIAKSKGSDATVEKIISNFLRRGGSPNTAKQSASEKAVKYGYGMIHALIVTKTAGALDLLLQQGANPNAMTLSQAEDDKATPCFLAAGVGWLAGLQKLVQAGGDLVAARGAGVRNKTALHIAAEHCHAAVVEYIVSATQGALNLEEDSQGATVLHYACASGHTDLVSFLVRSCQIPVNQPDHRGELPLHWAARHGRLEVVTLLVERCGCDVNAHVPRKLGTPLDLAKAAGQRRLVDYLKRLGALTARKAERRRDDDGEHHPGELENKFAKNGFASLFGGDGHDDDDDDNGDTRPF